MKGGVGQPKKCWKTQEVYNPAIFSRNNKSATVFVNDYIDGTVPYIFRLEGPVTNLPFDTCAIYFDLKVNSSLPSAAGG